MTQFEFEVKRHQMCDTITGCAYKAYNYWHAGVDELVYEAGLCCELEDAGYYVHRQEDFPTVSILNVGGMMKQHKSVIDSNNLLQFLMIIGFLI